MGISVDTIASKVNSVDTASANSNKSLGQADFLKLLTTQLTTQDPTNPMDNSAFVAQMAQFSTLTAMNEMSASFESLADTLSGDRVIQASGLIERVVQVDSAGGGFFDGENMVGAVMMEYPSSNVTVNIYTETGELVQKIGLDGSQGEDLYFNWDGIDKDGVQRESGRFRMEAVAQYGDESSMVKIETLAKVESVSIGKGGAGTRLYLQGIGDVDMSSVHQIF